jgi:preprotein translocase subunit SecA
VAILNTANQEKQLIDQKEYDLLMNVIKPLTDTFKNDSEIDTSNEFMSSIINSFQVLKESIVNSDYTTLINMLANIKITNLEDLAQFLSLIINDRNIQCFKYSYYYSDSQQNAQNIQQHICYIRWIAYIDHDKSWQNLTQHDLKLRPWLAIIVTKNYLNIDIEHFFESINNIMLNHGYMATYLSDMLNNLPEYYVSADNTQDNITALMQTLSAIANSCLANEASGIISEILINYQKEPLQLIQIWQMIQDKQYQPLLPALRCFNHYKKTAPDRYIDIISRLSQNQNTSVTLSEKINQYFIRPPYPNLDLFSNLCSIATAQQATEYNKFSQNPYATPENARQLFGFEQEKFINQTKLFIADNTDLQGIFDDNTSYTFATTLAEMHAQSTKQLYERIKQQSDIIERLSGLITMLARTTAQKHPNDTTQTIGQQVNATQTIALYAMITAAANGNKKIISEIATGEGKSRIMMILAAYQALAGNTVDFITENFTLASRDFIAYSDFFAALDIPSRLISHDAAAMIYLTSAGVNFVAGRELILLRNKDYFTSDNFTIPSTDKRCGLFDEVDVFTHDQATVPHNIATPSLALSTYTWIYSFLIQYMEHIYDDKTIAEPAVDDFVNFVLANCSIADNIAQLQKLQAENKQQIVIWLQSAQTAWQLQYKVDYDYTEHKVISIDHEDNTRLCREILILQNGQILRGSAYNNGVQQCLAVILNKQTKSEDFLIKPEYQTLHCSFTIDLLNYYAQLFGVTATPQKPPMLTKIINYQDYRYLKVPRHHALQRQDKRVWVAKDYNQQIKFIQYCIQEKFNTNDKWAILVICKNDQQSQKIFNELNKAHENNITCMIAQNTTQQDEENIATAGKNKQITVATLRIGRGVDINTEQDCTLLVLYCDIFPEANALQIKGRTGRNGKPGETRQIINLQDHPHINGWTHNINAVINAAIQQLTKDRERLIYHAYAYCISTQLASFKKNSMEDQTLQITLSLDTWQKQFDQFMHDHRQSIESAQNATDSNNIKNNFWSEVVQKASTTDTQQKLERQCAIIFNALSELIVSSKTRAKQPIILAPETAYHPSMDGQSGYFGLKVSANMKGKRFWFADWQASAERRGSCCPDLLAFCDYLLDLIRRFIEILTNLCTKKDKEVSIPAYT